MAPIDYFPQRSALYEVDETSPFLTNYADFFSSYDDIARKYQSERDKAQQEYKDLLTEASRPRPVGGGELLTQALLSFGAPLLGKAIGGNAVGAAGSDLAQKAISDLDVKLDADYKTTQQALALQAQEAKRQMGAFDEAILELPFKKLDRQGQMIANHAQSEDTFARQAQLQEDSQAHAIQLKSMEPEIEGRIARAREKAKYDAAREAGLEGSDGLDGSVEGMKNMFRLSGKEMTPSQEAAYKRDLVMNPKGARDQWRRELDKNVQLQQTMGGEGALIKPIPGQIPKDFQIREATKIATNSNNALMDLSLLENIITTAKTGTLEEKQAAFAQLPSAYNGAVINLNKIAGLGGALPAQEMERLKGQLGPIVQASRTFDDFINVTTSGAMGAEALSILKLTQDRLKAQTDRALRLNRHQPIYGVTYNPESKEFDYGAEPGSAAMATGGSDSLEAVRARVAAKEARARQLGLQ